VTTVEGGATPKPKPARRGGRRRPILHVLSRVGFYALIAVIFVYAVFPFYWALKSAFTVETELFKTPIQYVPSSPTLENFRNVLSSGFFQRALLNSTIVAGSVTLLCLAIASVGAYALGRFDFRGRSTSKLLMLSMTTFPQIAILGALYTFVNRVGLFNTLGALILTYIVFTLPFTVWVLTSFTEGLPKDLEEAAYVDGASPFQTFYRVFLPLLAPGLVTVGLLAFIAAWNEFLYALSFEQTPDKWTVPVAIVNFTGAEAAPGSFETPWGQIMAATVIVTVPLVALTLLLQRWILAGLTAGAVKG
jgi:trehalose/maltose transport system permease protein